MNNLSGEQIIAIFGLAATILGTLAAALTVEKTLTRFILIVFTLALALVSFSYISESFRNEKALKELSKEEIIQEAKRQLVEEQANRDEAFSQARERLDQERIEREAAEKAAKEADDRDEIEREARETIIREDAVKKLREQTEAEKAEKARQLAEALIVGKWDSNSWWLAGIEFTDDDKYIFTYNVHQYTRPYKVVDAMHVDIKTAFGNYITWRFEVSGDTLHFSSGTFTRIK